MMIYSRLCEVWRKGHALHGLRRRSASVASTLRLTSPFRRSVAAPANLFARNSPLSLTFTRAMASKSDQGREYHRTATGDAVATVKAHEKDAPITLFGSCFCPFVQRVWAALEFYGIEYKVCHVYTLLFHSG
jgi:hypothetical protein